MLQIALSHTSEMPFGRHKGKKLSKISAVYLLLIYDKGCTHTGLRLYIEGNMNKLKSEAGYKRIKV